MFSKCFNEISALFSARNFMLFNFQGTMRSEDRCTKKASALEALDYYTAFFGVCQANFSKIFSFFALSLVVSSFDKLFVRFLCIFHNI